MDASFESCGFLFQFPLWLIGLSDQAGRPRGSVKAKGKAGEVALPIFTDEDLAERFIKTLPPGVYDLKLVPDPVTLLGFLVLLERKGYTHVLVDHSRKKALPMRIPDVIADLFRWSD